MTSANLVNNYLLASCYDVGLFAGLVFTDQLAVVNMEHCSISVFRYVLNTVVLNNDPIGSQAITTHWSDMQLKLACINNPNLPDELVVEIVSGLQYFDLWLAVANRDELPNEAVMRLVHYNITDINMVLARRALRLAGGIRTVLDTEDNLSLEM